MRKILRKIRRKVANSRVLPRTTQPSKQACRNVLDPEYYHRANPDLEAANAEPLQHFQRFGAIENRNPNAWFSQSYIQNYFDQDAMTSGTATNAYVNSDLSQKPRLIFVSHDASRTGAPAIILRLLEIFSDSRAFECFTILDEGGERLSEFQALSHTYVMSRSRRDREFSELDAYDELSGLFSETGVFEGNRPVGAIVNSAESSHIGRHLAALKIPMIFLIHEIAAYYKPTVMEDFCRLSEKVIFPSNFVKNVAEQYCDLDRTKSIVRGQGLLTEGFGSLSRGNCRRLIREELQIEDDAFIILNVGSLDLRKGADLFVDTSKLFSERGGQSRPVYFVWFGATDKNFNYPHEFIEQHGLEDRVRLMPPTPEIEQVFMGSDIFLLTARADPFPCVVHEAMACGLPVIAFRGGGGAPELIGDDCGTIVDMMNLTKVCETIETYINDQELHDMHSRNAVEKIAQNWCFIDYQKDVYGVMQDCFPAPQRNWPTVSLHETPEHLVIMHGTAQDMELLPDLLDQSKSPGYEIVLIDGRFGQEIETTIQQLCALGHSYRVKQPTTDTPLARAEIVAQLLQRYKPRKVTLVNTLQYLTPTQLKPLSYHKAVVQTDGSVSVDDFYLMLPFLDSITVEDSELVTQLAKMNPRAVSQMTVLGSKDTICITTL